MRAVSCSFMLGLCGHISAQDLRLRTHADTSYGVYAEPVIIPIDGRYDRERLLGYVEPWELHAQDVDKLLYGELAALQRTVARLEERLRLLEKARTMDSLPETQKR